MLASRVWARASRRPTLVAAALYALLSLAFVAPALVPGKTLSSSDIPWFENPWASVKPETLVRPANANLRDAPLEYQPWLRYTRDRLPSAPLWNPYTMGGRPFIANGQSAVFSPFSLPAYLLPFWSSLALIAALKLFVAAFGAYLLSRALGMRVGGALLAGLVYGFNLFLVTWLSWPHSSVWTLLPWLLLLTDRLVSRPGLLPGAGLAAVVALQFVGGQPEASFHVLFATLAFLALRLVQARRAGRLPAAGMRAPILGFAGALAGGAALAAVAILPFAELLLHSSEIDQQQTDQHLAPRALVTLLLPEWWGRATGVELQFFFHARAFYAGALPLLLATLALVLRPTLERVAVAAFGTVAMAITFALPPIFQLFNAVPGVDRVNNARMPILAMLCVALLAGWALDDLSARRLGPGRARAAMWVAGALLCVPVALVLVGAPSLSRVRPALDLAWGFGSPVELFRPESAKDTIRLGAVVMWLTFAGIGIGLLALRLRRRIGPAALVALSLALVAADLFRFGMGFNPALDKDVAVQPATGGIRFLQARRSIRVAAVGRHTLHPDLSMRYGLYDARGYDFPVEERFDRLWRQVLHEDESGTKLGFPHYARLVPLLDNRRLRPLSLLGVRYLMQARADPPQIGLPLVYDGPDSRVYENPRALPRAFVAGEQRVVADGDAALAAITAPGFDARRVAVAEHPLPGVPASEGRAGSARIVRYEPERVTIEARAARPGVLVLTDLHYPGWKAKVDGNDERIHRVDYLFRGIALPPGAHRIEFRYEPASWRIGWIVSLLALAGLVVAVAVGVRRATPRPPP